MKRQNEPAKAEPVQKELLAGWCANLGYHVTGPAQPDTGCPTKSEQAGQAGQVRSGCATLP
eukprot:353546-Chlamydomonas_euryale.AAC.2